MLRKIFKGWHLLLAFAFATAGQSRLNLAQETAEVTLNFAAKAELDSSFENATAAAISTARPKPTTRQTPGSTYTRLHLRAREACGAGRLGSSRLVLTGDS